MTQAHPPEDTDQPARSDPADTTGPVWAEGFTPLSLPAPVEDDLPGWMTALAADDVDPGTDASSSEPEPAPGEASGEPASVAPPADHTFRPRTTARLMSTVLLLAGVVVTGSLAREVYLAPDRTGIVATAVAAFVTAVISAVRSSIVVTRVAVRDGTLEVVRDGTRTDYDLSAGPSPVEIAGTPGRRGWRAVLTTRGSEPVELGPADVDPTEFTRVMAAHARADPTNPETGSAPGTRRPQP